MARWLKREWDRTFTYVLFMAYGVYGMIFPIISVDREVPYPLQLLLGAEFVFAGASMIWGLHRNHYVVWRLGMWVAVVGLSTIALLIAFSGGFRVLAYAFLFAAFAMQCKYGVRREQTRRTEQEIRRQLEAIVEAVNPKGLSDDTSSEPY